MMKEGWERKKLGEISTFFEDGNWIESKDQSIDGIRLIQTGNVGKGVFKNRKNKARYISKETFKRLKCTEIYQGDCLVSRLPDPIGRACILPKLKTRMITAVDCSIIRFDEEQIISEWFVYYSLSNSYFKEIQNHVTGATRQRISRKNLGLISIPIPPISEQKRIVSILDETFAKIETLENNAKQNLENAKELFESYLQNVFEKKGEDWEEKTLDKISENLDSKRIPITKNVRTKGDIPYYGASGIVDYVSEFIFEEELLCISEDGANLLARTYPIAFSISGKTWVNNHAHVLRFPNLITQKYVEIYINSIRIDEFISGMAQPKLNQRMLNSIPIPIPPIEEQDKIVKHLNILRTETKKLETLYQQKLVALEELKKSILEKAFKGELSLEKIEAG